MGVTTKSTKISPDDCEPTVLSGRTNFKLVDPSSPVCAEHVTMGYVIVEPGAVCKPGHSHDDQEEICFCLSGHGIITVEEQKEIAFGPRDLIYLPKGAFHCIRNAGKYPLEAIWIVSPSGWAFDKSKNLMEKAVEGEDLK